MLERRAWGTQTLGSGPGCMRVISYDPPVNLEAVLIIELETERPLVTCQRAQSKTQVCDDSAHVPVDTVPPQVLSAYVTFSYEDPFKM